MTKKPINDSFDVVHDGLSDLLPDLEMSWKDVHALPVAMAIMGAVLCFALRLMAIRYGRQFPTAWAH